MLPIHTLTKALKKANIPGASIAIGSKNSEIKKQEVGVSSKNHPQEINKTTLFEAASLSKPVFAFIVLKLVECGKFSRPGESAESGLDRPLCEISKFGPPHLHTHPFHRMLTPRLILSHQSGLPNWFLPGAGENYISMPGKEFNYSGVAFCFLCDVLENVSGKSLEHLAQELFAELTMTSSSFLPFEEGKFKKRNRAIGHNAAGKADDKEHFPNGSRPNPAASLLTTAEDYAKFLKACIADPFISKYMFEPQLVLAGKDKKAITAGVEYNYLAHMMWGLGIGLQIAPDGTMIAFHWGDIETSRAFTAINLQTQQLVVCLTNTANGTLLFKQVAEPIVGDLRAICQWLTHREGLKLYAEPKLSPLTSTKLGFFSAKEYLIERRHDNVEAQHQYDKQFGLIVLKK